MASEVHLTADQRAAVEEFRKRHRTALLALLFTDIEHSTALRREMGELPASALMERHNAIIREVLAEFSDAQEISTAGDSFFIAFAKPSDAARFALLAQTRLRQLAEQSRPDFRVRTGIHLGEVVVEEEAVGGPARDILGMQVDLAARVTALAAGGQILMTRGVFDNARQILKGQLLPGVGELSWLNHGPYLLKGFDDPSEICEVGEAAAAPLRQPEDCPAAQRATVPGSEPVLGWRPAIEQTVPGTEWQLEEKLGEGGFGEVWLAQHRRTKDVRVFKFCFRADRLRSLKREMTLFRILKEVLGERPDIARLYSVQFEEAPYYLELEYTPGGNLLDWIKRKSQEAETTKAPRHKEDSLVSSCLGGESSASALPLSLRLEIVAQIATALSAAHSVGVIHKDVKPSNILIEERVGQVGNLPDSAQQPKPSRQVANLPHIQVRLTDFGIGQLMDREALERAGITATGFTETAGAMTELSSRTGTRLYMAPELLAGRPPSIQSDIYSLGVLLYQMILGDLSQPMTTDWERHVPDPLLRDDLRRCLAGNPSERFAGANELARDLRALPERQAELVKRQAAERAAVRRRRVALILGAAAALFSLLAVALGYGLRREKVQRIAADQASRQAIEEKNRAEQQLYYSNIAQAEKCIEEFRYERARQLLEECPRQYRNWEWGRFQYLFNLDLMTLKGHTDGVRSVVFSPDGKRLATASSDNTAKVWDSETGRELLTLKGHAAYVLSVAFSPGGKRLATGSYDNTAKVWDSETGRELLTLKGHTLGVESIVFSPDGKRLATGSWDNTAKIWDAETGRELLTHMGHGGSVTSVAFSPDGKRLATAGDDKTAKVWDSETGRELVTLKGHTAQVSSVAFSPDGKRLATASWDKTAKVWDSETGRELLTLKGHTDSVYSVAFSRDGKRLATASEHTAKVWDSETGRELLTLKGPGVGPIVFSPDGKRLATASGDSTAKLWDAETGREFVTLRGRLSSQVFSPDGKRLATACDDGTAKVWDAETGRELVTLKGHAGRWGRVVFSPDGKRLAMVCDDGTAKLWDAETGLEILTLKGHTGSVWSVVFSPDGKRLATASNDGTAKIWDAGTGRELVTLKGETPTVDFSPDGKRYATLGDRRTSNDPRTAKIWDAETGLEILTLNISRLFFLVFSPDGKRVATASENATATIWDVETGRALVTLKDYGCPLESVAFSPDGKRLATASRSDAQAARLWDAETGRELVTLKGHTGSVWSVVFSPDGKRLATASNDGTAKIWDAGTGRELVTLKGDTPTVHFSPDGKRLATAGDDGTAIIWNALPWRDEDLPGDSSMSYDERIQLYKLERWKEKAPTPTTATIPADVVKADEEITTRTIAFAEAPKEKIEEERANKMEACAGKLRQIHASLVRYRADHQDQLPNWLSDLVPQYLTSDTLLCPADEKRWSPYYRDPKTSSSYSYQFNASPMAPQYREKNGKTVREWKEKQLKEFGDIVPVVRCMHHSETEQYERVVNLSYGGKIYLSPLVWEKGPREDYPKTASSTSPGAEREKQK
jgi:WD40 repeat protein/serine/threonine protein kinase/class 3 adenylate cyclase